MSTVQLTLQSFDDSVLPFASQRIVVPTSLGLEGIQAVINELATRKLATFERLGFILDGTTLLTGDLTLETFLAQRKTSIESGIQVTLVILDKAPQLKNNQLLDAPVSALFHLSVVASLDSLVASEDLVFVGLANGTLSIYNVKDLLAKKAFTSPSSTVQVGILPINSILCVSSTDEKIGTSCIYVACGTAIYVYKFTFSFPGKENAKKTSKESLNCQLAHVWEHSDTVQDIKLLQEIGLVAGTFDGSIYLWALEDGKSLYKGDYPLCIFEEAHGNAVMSMVRLGATLFMTCSLDSSLKLWTVKTTSNGFRFECLGTFAFGMPLIALNGDSLSDSMEPSSFVICVATVDSTLSLHTLSYTQGKYVLKKEKSWKHVTDGPFIQKIAFSLKDSSPQKDFTRIRTASHDGRVRLWSTLANQSLSTLVFDDVTTTCKILDMITFSSKGSSLLLIGKSNGDLLTFTL